MAIDELKAPAPSLFGIAMWADDQYALEPCGTHPLRQTLDIIIAEGLPDSWVHYRSDRPLRWASA